MPELREVLRTAPQTNEVGRSAALLAGLFDLVRASGMGRIRLLELGASAGLNLLLDEYGFSGVGWRGVKWRGVNWHWGPPGSPLQLASAIEGPVEPVPLKIAERRGCDLQPLDPRSERGRLVLTSFVWPFDLHRHERLRAALLIAERCAAPVDQASAGEWLAWQLHGSDHDEDLLTVVWHSVTRQYWPAAEVDRVAATLATYGRAHRLADVSLEYESLGSGTAKPVLETTLWSGGEDAPRRRRLGTAHDHGVPVRLDPRST